MPATILKVLNAGARDLQEIFGYTEWRNFLKAIDKAKNACEKSGVKVSDHFVDVNKMVPLGSGAERKIEDIAFTRYACYLVAKRIITQTRSRLPFDYAQGDDRSQARG